MPPTTPSLAARIVRVLVALAALGLLVLTHGSDIQTDEISPAVVSTLDGHEVGGASDAEPASDAAVLTCAAAVLCVAGAFMLRRKLTQRPSTWSALRPRPRRLLLVGRPAQRDGRRAPHLSSVLIC